MAKYLILEARDGILMPVIFPDHVDHSKVAVACRELGEPRSAGFVHLSSTNRGIITHGQSTSLKMAADPRDERWIERLLSQRL